jgi:uncharacterized membrane protein
MTAFYILISIGLLFIFVACGIGAYENASIKNGTIVEGTVVGNVRRSNSKGSSYSPEVTFRTKQGQDVRFTATFSTNPPLYSQGDAVRIVYRDDGQNPRILSFGVRFGVAWCLLCAGVALVIIAYGFKYGESFVNSYYVGSTFLSPR